MTKAPERIWGKPDEKYGWDHGHASNVFCDDTGSEYVRADIVPQWQPIETAPSDIHILVMEDDDIYKAILVSDDDIWESFCGQPVVWDAEPTHWMPLPSAPKSILPS